ncbi:hypothetical protein K458DRAFT_418591 [Lentithecium fluviatile CBS 122367]|uniref:Aminoglycoside phosphotransferase domain-containing protein n=1 Tax=Lentithecium fluviatile CBS 122367 TaxID=1168545 RepID=A0A6G1IZQ7_9PLEO|nr:hypothetical protein K458DRAFT_418591 [Lentithecium fluviatile CBS 122367]
MPSNLGASFWVRMGLQEADRNVCIRAIESVYPHKRVEEFANQGHCSFTILVSSTPEALFQEDGDDTGDSAMAASPFIVQIRPQQHSLDQKITWAAYRVYGSLVPSVRTVQCPLPRGLTAVEMDLKEGVPSSRLLSRARVIDAETSTWNKQVRLVESLASFIACAWPSIPSDKPSPRYTRADSPMSDGPSWLAKCPGKVGANIVRKLEKLSHQLPDAGLRERARDTLDRLMRTADYPVVLNQGDLIPTNILIDRDTWEITGVVDWAEAEWLPFGTCLYGLEHLLGYLDCSSSAPEFRYYEGSEVLRKLFWLKLAEEKPEVEASLKNVEVMRDIGVLLWLGYAWDDGQIDRVVNYVDDGEELARLRAFLEVSGG